MSFRAALSGIDWLRLLCAVGIHWRGSSGCSCLHNIKVCDVCKRDVDGILIHDRNRQA